jgi:ribonucleoside-triphosphate reductase
MTRTEIETRIAELEAQRAHPGEFPTEIYTRIVGYYRSLANWNAGKREEYDHRLTFREDAGRIQGALDKAAARRQVKASSYLIFTQKSCPNCPAMKAKLPALSVSGQDLDVASDAGYEAAMTWSVTATPTLILLDADGRELDRIMTASDWKSVEGYL